MKFTTYFNSKTYLENSKIQDWILCDPRVSLNQKGFGELTSLPSEFDAKFFSLEADRLVTENEFEGYIQLIKQFYELGVRRFRIKDIGILDYFKNEENLNNFLGIKFIFNLESGGHHNFESIYFYQKNYADIIEKLIISTEITFENLKEISSKISLPIEIFGLGPILLFYTPRKLLSNQIKEHLQGLPDYQKEFVANGTSMESPHSGFEIIQNSGGTLMYAPNHFCLLDLVGNLEDIGVDSVRLDIRDLEDDVQINVLSNYLKSLNDQQMKEFKQVYPKRVLKGLFVVNKSKVLFKKLKNKRLEDVQNHHAMVVEVVKNSHMLIKQIGEQVIKVNDQILIQSPDGREKTVQLKWLKALDGNNCDQTIAGKHFIVSVVPAISIKSKITVLN